MINLLICW